MGDPGRLAYIIYTSGTSGTPRAVGHAHRAIWARQMMMADWYGLAPSDRLLHAGAFNWTYTLGTGLMDPWTMGATALIPAAGTEPSQLPLLMKPVRSDDLRRRAGCLPAGPEISRAPAAAPAARLAAGEKLSEAIRAHWHAATGTAIYEAYGMSECSTFMSAAPGRQASGRLHRPAAARTPRGTRGRVGRAGRTWRGRHPRRAWRRPGPHARLCRRPGGATAERFANGNGS